MERGPCSLWSRLKGRGSRCIATAFSDLGGGKAVLVRYGAARHGPVGNGEAVMARLGEVRLGMAVTVGLGRASQGKAVKVRQGKAGSGAAWRSRFGPARLGPARSGKARRSRSGTFCHGPARLGLAVVVGLGVMSQLESWRDGLGEVCCVRATLGLSGRSWCVLACCGNARQQRECGGRGNSPLCGQGGPGVAW